jgi:cytoplasmic iron level regulating protein YaaA (DUF328/UPF0246 family)
VPLTDVSVSLSAWFTHTYPVLILLPPSEKKAANPGAAINVYTGVLYKALDWGSLTSAAQERGQRSLAIISAKYGALKPLDLIAPYKQKINNSLMREPVTRVLDAVITDLIIDCRSSTYKSVWTPPHCKCVDIKVLTSVDGTKKVITHMSKKTRGEVTRTLLEEISPTNPQELFEIISPHFQCQLIDATATSPWVLEVIAR